MCNGHHDKKNVIIDNDEEARRILSGVGVSGTGHDLGPTRLDERWAHVKRLLERRFTEGHITSNTVLTTEL